MIMVLYENVLIDTMQIMERFVIICDFLCQYSAHQRCVTFVLLGIILVIVISY